MRSRSLNPVLTCTDLFGRAKCEHNNKASIPKWLLGTAKMKTSMRLLLAHGIKSLLGLFVFFCIVHPVPFAEQITLAACVSPTNPSFTVSLNPGFFFSGF